MGTQGWVADFVVYSTSRGEGFRQFCYFRIKAKNLFLTYERSALTGVVYHA